MKLTRTPKALLTALLLTLAAASARCYDVTEPLGTGTTADPYKLSTLQNLAWAMTTPASWNKTFLLVNDIDATATRTWTGDNAGFLGLGRTDDPFTGVFEGDNKKITGLFMASNLNSMGFFIKLSGRVQSLTLASVEVTGGDNTGGLVAILVGQVIDCTVGGKVDGDSQTGGIVGKMEAGSEVGRSTSNASVTGIDNVGGIAGYGCGILDTIATGTISGSAKVGGITGTNGCEDGILRSKATGDVSGTDTVGGLEGEGLGPVVQSVAKGNVTASGVGAGGLAGINRKAISDSYAIGTVSAADSAGGLVGLNSDSTATISRTYANGTVTAPSGAGGLVGRTSGFPSVTASYYDRAGTGLTTSAGGLGVISANMNKAATFSSWDFSTIWEIVELVSPPTLQWENLGSGGSSNGGTTTTDQLQVIGFDMGCFLKTLSR